MMTSKLETNKTQQDSTKGTSLTPPNEKMGNYLSHTSESYSDKQGLEITKQYVPFSDNQEMSSHNLNQVTPLDSSNNQELTSSPNHRDAVEKNHETIDTFNWYSDQIEAQSNIRSTDDSTKFAQSEDPNDQDLLAEMNQRIYVTINSTNQNSKTSLEHPLITQKNLSLEDDNDSTDSYSSQNTEVNQTQISKNLQYSQIEKIENDTNSKKFELECISKNVNTKLVKNLKARVTNNTWQDDNCTNTTSSNDSLHTEAIKESNRVQEAKKLSFKKDNTNTTHFLKDLPNTIMKSTWPTSNYDISQSLMDYPPRQNENGEITRHYSPCHGHLPYTTLFITFAPPINNAQEDTGGKTFKKTKEAKARIILSKMNRKLTHQQDETQENSNRNSIPEYFLTWKSKTKNILPKQRNSTTIEANAHGASSDFHNFKHFHLEEDNRSPMDKEVDRLQDFNDKIIASNGFHIIPFRMKEQDLSSLLYAGSMITELKKNLIMYICKPCDKAGFDRRDFLIHHTTTKHEDNTRTWIHQNYIQPIHTNDDNTSNHEKNHAESLDHNTKTIQTRFDKAMFDRVMDIVRDQSFPEKHRVDVACLITKFYTAPRHYDIAIMNGFTMSHNTYGQKHWILSASEELKNHQDTRHYLKNYSKEPNFEFLIKSHDQELEVEGIADLARKLFKILIICDFVPTNYLSILAIIMCQQPKFNYPKSNIRLANGHYIDLLLQIGAIQMTHRNYNKEDENSHTQPDTLTRDQNTPSNRKRKSNVQTNPPNHEEVTESMDARSIQSRSRNMNNDYLPFPRSVRLNSGKFVNKSITERPIYKYCNKVGSQKETVSRDVNDGNMPNYRQTCEGSLLRSSFGYPICNYCGKPGHKRENCKYKTLDRVNGLTRINHPDKEKNTTEITGPETLQRY